MFVFIDQVVIVNGKPLIDAFLAERR